jgi:hypothetical protein
MGGGASSGGSTDIPLRQPSQEWPSISNWYEHQQNEFNNFTQNQPLLNTAEHGALTNYGNLGQLTDPLMSLLGSTPGQYQGLFNQLGDNAGQFNGLFGQLGQTADRLGGIEQGLPNVSGLTDPLNAALRNQINPVLQSGGALTGQQLRDVNQQTLANASAAGSAFSPGTLGTEAVNAQREREARFSNYLGMGQNVSNTVEGLTATDAGLRGTLLGEQAGIRGQQGNLLGQQAGVYGQQGNLVGQEASTVGGLSSLVQGLQSGGLNQLLGSEQANVGSFTGLENPILSYLSNLYTSNEQASIAQAQVNAQANQASQGKTGGAISGGIGAIGSIAGPLIAL